MCSVTCLNGVDNGGRTRYRECLNGQQGDDGCEGDRIERTTCTGMEACPEIFPWGQWSACSRSCGVGKQRRSRSCDNGEEDCPYFTEEEKACNLQACPYWSFWGQWTACSENCGEGFRTRIRICVNGLPGDIGCDEGTVEEAITCNLGVR